MVNLQNNKTANTNSVFMNNKHLLFFVFIFIIASCSTTPEVPTNEEKAENLVSGYIKDYLTYPDSYEAISTKIDSSFVNVSRMEEIVELSEECSELYDKITTLEQRIEYAQSKMEIYSARDSYYSEHSKGEHNRAKAEKEEYELEIKYLSPKLEEKVLALRNSTSNLYDNEFNGWAVTHRFRCKNDYGTQMPPQEMVFLCDVNFENCQAWTAKQINCFFKIIECINESDTDKILLNNLQELRFLFNYF